MGASKWSLSALKLPTDFLVGTSSRHPVQMIVGLFVLSTLVYFQLLNIVTQSERQWGSGIHVSYRPETGTWSEPWTDLVSYTSQDDTAFSPVYMQQLAVVNKGPTVNGWKKATVEAVDERAKAHRCLQEPSGSCWHVSQLIEGVNGPLMVTSWAFLDNDASVAFAEGLLDEAKLVLPDDKGAVYIKEHEHTGGILHGRGGGHDIDEDLWALPPRKENTFKVLLTSIRVLKAKVQQTAPADILVMVIAYVFMLATLVSLFVNIVTTFGTNREFIISALWTGAFGFLSGAFAIMCGLLCAVYLGIPLSTVTLSEMLPFFVIVVGYDKPVRLVRTVWAHPDIGFSHQVGDKSDGGLRISQAAPSRHVITESISRCAPIFFKDAALVVFLLLCAAVSGVSGLQDFSQIALLLVFFDFFFLFAFFTAFLTIMVEVYRIKLRDLIQRTDSSQNLAQLLDDPTQTRLGGVGENDASGEQADTTSYSFMRRLVFKFDSPARKLEVVVVATLLVVHLTNFLNSSVAPAERSASKNAAPYLDPCQELVSLVSGPLLVHIGYAATLWYSRDASIIFEKPSASASLNDTSALFRMLSAYETSPYVLRWLVFGLVLSILLNVHLLRSVRSSNDAFSVVRGPAVDEAVRKLWGEEDDEMPRHARRTSYDVSLSHKQLQNQWTREDAERFAEDDERQLKSQDDRSHRQVPKTIEVIPNGTQNGALPIHVHPVDAASRSSSRKRADSREMPPFIPPAEPTTQVTRGANDDWDKRPSPSRHVTPSRITSLNRIELPANAASHIPEGDVPNTPRPFSVVQKIYSEGGALLLNDEELILLVQEGKLPAYNLEKALDPDFVRAVSVRRQLIGRAQPMLGLEHSKLPYAHFDYSAVVGQCCENVIGYMPLPVGLAGPVRIDGRVLSIPLATTEGVLVASTARGCKALNSLDGVRTVITRDAMTRGPVMAFSTATEAAAACLWCESPEGFEILKTAFEATSRYAKLKTVTCSVAGRYLFARFATQTGDAMGMNMISKGCEAALTHMAEHHFPEMRVLSISGNYCTDKKPAAINWIQGRGKSVVAECIVPKEVVEKTLKTTVPSLCELSFAKNFVGSAMAGAFAGNNAHAANIVAAVFIACGQDPAQVVESANCMTIMQQAPNSEDLFISVTMPSIEVGTIGGGTALPPQRAMLDMLGVAGPHPEHPGENAQQLARAVAAAVMAGELSLMSALAKGDLVKSHMAHNRKK